MYQVYHPIGRHNRVERSASDAFRAVAPRGDEALHERR